MRFSCPCCGTDYAVPNGKVPRGYYKVVCSHCEYKWRKSIGINTNLNRQRTDLEKDINPGLTSSIVRSTYRPEVLAILREEAAVETRLRHL